MARNNKKRRKKKVSSPRVPVFRYFVVLLLVGFLLFVSGRKILGLIQNAHYFKVKEIVCASDTQFDYVKKFSYLRGKSIFKVNLAEVQKELQWAYPQAAQIRVARRFPSQIVIELETRMPFARFAMQGVNGTIDSKGYVISKSIDGQDSLPIIVGFSVSEKDIKVGSAISSQALKVAIKIVSEFNRIGALSSYQIQKIDVKNLSKINFYLTQKFNIILDQDNIVEKLHLLSAVLSRAKLDIEKICYIDIRFKEPVIKTND
ncbi:MAG: cell division protein FtsQ/DivIB [Candidatus Aceula meridiana]|nr:cell division protein FtsQ/DivIB [Candidatus Aceula meridiana]